LSPNQLSEGTFKTIALLFYLVIDKGSLLLIEEPEVCIHHGLLKSILTLVKSYSASKQIIIATHSDFVLDTLAPENVFLVRKEHGQGTKVKAVTKALSSRDFAALKVYLADTGNLGEFWRHGGLAHD
jgi:predicted ATPase